MSQTSEPLIVRDIWQAIDYDSYAWIPIWGNPRSGKTTVALSLMFKVYKDWDDVLNAVIFNLNGLLYKMQHGQPRLFPTRNEPIHYRVPILLWDDFAAHGGKAQTQYERAWDVFKGAFDTLGTRLGVLLATMVNPRSPTQQLLEKYTHEVLVENMNGNRLYKYDRCGAQQDFYGWKARQSKSWIETQQFTPIPLDVYKAYDEMRLALVDESFQVMQDTMVETSMDRLLKLTQPTDLNLLELISNKGPVNHHRLKDEIGEDGKLALLRCKARGLVTPVRKGEAYYVYDITPLGFDLLKSHKTQETKESQSSLNKIH